MAKTKIAKPERTWKYGPYVAYVEIPTEIGVMGLKAGEILEIGFTGDEDEPHYIDRYPAPAGVKPLTPQEAFAQAFKDQYERQYANALKAEDRGHAANADAVNREARAAKEPTGFVPQIVSTGGGWYEWTDQYGEKHKAQGLQRAKAEAGLV